MSCEIKWALNKMPKTEDKNLSHHVCGGGKESKGFP